MKYHCLFEQSGTFKNEFKKLGFEAFDYDILNNFNETDHQIDLFLEIERGYSGEPSIFDNFHSGEDYLLAFFPCTRFECQISMIFKGVSNQQQNWSDEEKLKHSMKLHEELHYLYMCLSKLCLIAIKKGLPLMIENPGTEPHYLTQYWPIRPTFKDNDRRDNGDYYKKPTNYWFINCEPEQNFIFEPISYIHSKSIEGHKKKDGEGINSEDVKELRRITRSMMHPQYANRFIRTYIIKE